MNSGLCKQFRYGLTKRFTTIIISVLAAALLGSCSAEDDERGTVPAAGETSSLSRESKVSEESSAYEESELSEDSSLSADSSFSADSSLSANSFLSADSTPTDERPKSGDSSEADINASDDGIEAPVEKKRRGGGDTGDLDSVNASPEEEIKVSGLKGSSGDKSITVRWKALEGAEGYSVNVFYPQSSRRESFDDIPADTREYTVSGLKAGTECHVSVSAYIDDGSGEKSLTKPCAEIKLTTMRERFIINGIKNIYQYSDPELPTGCECTSLAAVLNFYGYKVTKNDIADKYLRKISFYVMRGELHGADPEKAFPGDPENSNSYGCYSRPVADAANRYLKEQVSELSAEAVDGKKLEKLFEYVNSGTPVIIWATDSLVPSKETDSWKTSDNKTVTWLENEHCLVLAGFDKSSGTVYVCDPLRDTTALTEYDMALFETRYKEQGCRAAVIQ